MAIFKNDTATEIQIITDMNFSNYDIAEYNVKYIKPSGITGSWSASAVDGSESTGVISLEFSPTTYFDESGIWILYPEIVFEDNTHESGLRISVPVQE